MSLRVALLAEGSATGVGGIALHAQELGRALLQLGHDAVIVSVEQFNDRRNLSRWRITRVPSPVAGGADVWEAPLLWSPRRALSGLQLRSRVAPWLRALLAARGIDIVHWHGIDADCDLVSTLPPRYVRVFTNHSSQFLEFSKYAGMADQLHTRLEPAEAIIAPSRELVEATLALGAPPARVHYIPNGVDIDRYRPQPDLRRQSRAALGIADDAVVTLCARRFAPKNGLIFMARAAAKLDAASTTPHVLLIAGNGAGGNARYEEEVRRVLAPLGRGVSVRWLGWVPAARMPALLAATDIALLPSLVEATSLAGLEAMAAGCALLGTRTGGIPELIDDGITGRLVPPGDDAALADAWGSLITSPAARQRLGAAARARVEANFSWLSVAERTVAVYRSARPGGAPAPQ
jgi:glycosyltransferase involved in cell wall biosynthesis